MGEKYEGNAITINNLNKSKAEIIPKGNAEQETRSGSNILNFNVTQDSKVTVNDDGTVTINGTGGFGLKFEGITLKSGTTYYQKYQIISGSVTNSSDTGKIFMTIKEGQGYLTEGEFKSVSVTEDTNSNYVWIHANAVFENAVIKMWANTDQSDFEPYGAMPSPDYPSKVVTVGQNVNLFDKESATNNKYLSTTDGSLLNSSSSSTSDYINVEGNKNYIISGYENSNYYKVVCFYDKDKNFISAINTTNSNTEYTFATPTNTRHLRFHFQYTKINDIKLEKGSKATPYSPHGQGSVEIGVCNKNLAKINEKNWELTENNTIKNKARNQGIILTEMNMKANIKYKIHLKLFSKPTTASTFTCFLNDIAQSAKKAFVNINNFTLNTTYTIEFLLEEDMKFKMNFSGNTNSEIFEFQLWAEIDEATDYIPHESYTKVLPTQKEFVKIGDVEDTFVKVDGKWYEKHYSPKIIFDGTESWTYDSERYRFYKTISNSLISKISYALSSHFKNGNTETDNNAFNLGTKQIFFRNESIASTSDWKTWLAEQYNAGTPVIVYYVSQEPELIECTPEQSNILDQLENTELYDGINHITAFSSIEPMLEVTVKEPIEDYETYISSEGYLINNESNIKLLIDFNESNLPSMPEATESSIRAAGRNGDIVLATTYEPMTFDIVCYTEDNLTQAEKTIEEKKINKFLNSIKNKTITLAFENDRKFYNVKYSGALVTTNFPKHLKFSIPLKSSESYGKDLIEKSIVGNDTGESDTIENAGALITINGPAIKPIISLNDYSIEYDMDILEGAKIEIDSSKSTITHINSDGIKTNVMKYYNHQFPKIENGTNQLKILSGISNANNVMVKWNDLKL